MKLTMKQVVVLVAVFFLGYFVRSGCAGLIEGQENQQMLKCGGLPDTFDPYLGFNDNQRNGFDCGNVPPNSKCKVVNTCSKDEEKDNMMKILYEKLEEKDNPYKGANRPSDNELNNFKIILPDGSSLCNTKCPS